MVVFVPSAKVLGVALIFHRGHVAVVDHNSRKRGHDRDAYERQQDPGLDGAHADPHGWTLSELKFLPSETVPSNHVISTRCASEWHFRKDREAVERVRVVVVVKIPSSAGRSLGSLPNRHAATSTNRRRPYRGSYAGRPSRRTTGLVGPRARTG